MDVRRFDSMVRVFADLATRRGFVRNAALVAAGGALAVRSVRADGGDDGVGGGTDADIITPTPTAGSGDGSNGAGMRVAPTLVAEPPFPAYLLPSTCADLDFSQPINLVDVGASDLGLATGLAVPIQLSTTSVSVTLQKLVSEPHSVVIEAGYDDETVIVCGDLGDSADADQLAVGLVEQNLSGYSGVAIFDDEEATTTVTIYLGRGLFQMAPVADDSGTGATDDTSSEAEAEDDGAASTEVPYKEGDIVFATTDLSLRAQPGEDAEVVAIVGEGAELYVLGAAEDIWLPVEDMSGNTGYVNGLYVDQSGS